MKKILIVDDEPIILHITEKVLKEQYEIVTMSNGVEAMNCFFTESPDLVLSDINMPGMDGFEFFKMVRDMNDKRVPFVFMTSVDNLDRVKRDDVSEDEVGYLGKPIDIEQLKNVVDRLLNDARDDSMGGVAFSPAFDLSSIDLDSLDPDQLYEIPLVDEDAFFESVEIFTDYADVDMEYLDQMLKEANFDNYTTKTHGLKSTAQIIGATELSKKASDMEQAGMEGDYDFIYDHHPNLIDEYRDTKDAMSQKLDEYRDLVINDETLMGKALYLSSFSGVYERGINEKLKKDSGYYAGMLRDEIESIQDLDDDISVLVYFFDERVYEDTSFLVYLKDVCIEKELDLIVIGTKVEYDMVCKWIPSVYVTKWLDRAADAEKIIFEVHKCMKKPRLPIPSKTILIVDDDVAYMEIICAWLKGHYKVEMANSVFKAVQYLSMYSADLVLLDYDMPVADGTKLMEILQKDREFEPIPVMFLSGVTEKNAVMKAAQLQAEDYLLKNIDKPTLIKKINMHFENLSLQE